MPRLPALSGHDVIRILMKAGFEPRRRKGSHVVLVKGSGKHRIVVVIPDHQEVDKGTLVEILRQAKLRRDEFLTLV